TYSSTFASTPKRQPFVGAETPKHPLPLASAAPETFVSFHTYLHPAGPLPISRQRLRRHPAWLRQRSFSISRLRGGRGAESDPAGHRTYHVAHEHLPEEEDHLSDLTAIFQQAAGKVL